MLPSTASINQMLSEAQSESRKDEASRKWIKAALQAQEIENEK
jgi:hypothetical protein